MLVTCLGWMCFAALSFQVDIINSRSPALDYPCLKDKILWSTCVNDGRQPQFVLEMKHGTGGGQHPRLEGKVHLHCSFHSEVANIVSLGICHPCLLEGVPPRGRSSVAMEQPSAKSSAWGLPLHS